MGARESRRWVAWLWAATAVAVGVAWAGEPRYDPTAPPFVSLFRAFNDAYKQALYATSQGDGERSARELMAARLAWQMLLARHYRTPPPEFGQDQRWQTDLGTMGVYLEIADAWLKEGRVADAHESLEPIRRLWADLYQRNRVPWFGGELTRFHDLMEPVVEVASREVGESETAALGARLGEVMEAWRKVHAFPFKAESEEEGREFLEMMAVQDQALANLRRALEARDYTNLPLLAQAVKRAHMALYLRFG